MRDNTAVICLMAAGKARAKRKALFVAGYRSGRKDSPLLYLRMSFHKNTKVETPCNVGSRTSFSSSRALRRTHHLSHQVNNSYFLNFAIHLRPAFFSDAISEGDLITFC